MTILPSPRGAALLLLALCTAAAQAQGTPPASASRITAVKLYPGSATVERSARVAAGSTRAVFDCLPQGLDARSVQVQAGSGVRVGDITVQVRERALAPGCATPLDERLRLLAQRLAEARAETGALELAHSYLKSIAGNAPGTQPATGPGTPGAGQIAATTDALRRSGQDTLVRLHQARSREDDLERQFKALAAERERAAAQARVASVTVALAAAEHGAELRLSYQVRGPSWSPSYRATLDTAGTGPAVRLERLALVAQDTGEDWTDAALTLSTGQPLRSVGAPLPRPWTVDVRPAQPEAPRAPLLAPAPALAMRASAEQADAAAEAPAPDFTVAVAEGAYATEFAVPQRVTVPSGGLQVALALQAQQLGAALITRTTPAQEPAAYLVAQLPALPGVWPTGPVALYRDGAYVGQGTLDATRAQQELAFGRDERVAVTAEPERRTSASSGLTGARTERTTERSYGVTNRHTRAVQLQVLDAAPVSQDAQVQVESRYEPAPTETAWRAQPGTVAWDQPLAAGASMRFTARHTLRHDKELRLRERR